MKKIIFLFVMILIVFLTYQFTSNDKVYYVSLGDGLSRGTTPYNGDGYGYSDYIRDYLKNNDNLSRYNNRFTNKNYRITDIIDLIENNEEVIIDNKKITINHALSKADIITLSIGMNEIYYKIDNQNENLYTYIDEMMDDMSDLLNLIKKYNSSKVLVLGYYNYNNSNQKIIDYANLKLKELLNTTNFEYVDLSKKLQNNPSFFEKNTSFHPNTKGYEEISKIIIEKIKNY